MKKTKMKQLIAALRSGEYEQGKYALVNARDEFCCLGVACNISKQPLEWKYKEYRWIMAGKPGTLPATIQGEFGFHTDSGSRRDGKPIIINHVTYDALTVANDSGCTFEQIADYIETNYKQL